MSDTQKDIKNKTKIFALNLRKKILDMSLVAGGLIVLILGEHYQSLKLFQFYSLML